jgi:hypothetical protein
MPFFYEKYIVPGELNVYTSSVFDFTLNTCTSLPVTLALAYSVGCEIITIPEPPAAAAPEPPPPPPPPPPVFTLPVVPGWLE